MYEPKQLNDGSFVGAFYHPTKKCWRTLLTNNFNPSEAKSLNDLHGVRKYSSRDSVARALRKYKDKI